MALAFSLLLTSSVGLSGCGDDRDGSGAAPGSRVPVPFGFEQPTPTGNPTPTNVPHETVLDIVDRIPRSGWSEGIDLSAGKVWHAWPGVIRQLDMEGNVLVEFDPPSTYSESLAWFRGKLWNLSYHNANVYAGTLVDGALVWEIAGTVPDVAGWGITHDGVNLIVSGNGRPDLYVLDGDTLALVRTITTPIDDLEDLAWDGRYIWASSYSEYPGSVFRIDPDTGAVMDIHTLPDPEECTIVDGIAIDAGRIYVTGKGCPWIYVAPLPAE